MAALAGAIAKDTDAPKEVASVFKEVASVLPGPEG